MIALVAFLAAVAATAPAQPPVGVAGPAAIPTPAPTQAAVKKLGNPDKVVCKTIITTGTRFASQDCRKQAEWDQITANSKQTTTDTVNRQAVMFH